MDTQEIRENNDLVDTDTDLLHDTLNDTEDLKTNTDKNITNIISETKQYDEVLSSIDSFVTCITPYLFPVLFIKPHNVITTPNRKTK